LKHELTAAMAILLIGIFLVLLGVGLHSREQAGSEEPTQNNQQAETPVIHTVSRNNHGRVTVYSGDGKIFDCIGTVDMISSGWNGEEIKIIVYVDETEEAGN